MAKSKHPVLKIVRNILLVFLAVFLTAAGGIALKGYSMYTAALERLPIQKAAQEVRAKEGFTPLDELPDTYLEAVVAVEDHRFYEHGGIDCIAIGRAVYNDIRTLSFAEGGSTITQQLAKNLYFTEEKEFSRKAAEVFMAWALEGHFTKDEILELYVNSIYFGSGCYTAGDACRTYFGVEPEDMSGYQCAMLAGIPNAPSVYDPTENPELARQRQRQVVGLMVKYAGLSEEDAQHIRAGSVNFTK